MRALFIHADKMEFHARQKTPVAEEATEGERTGSARETLVCFVTVEAEDEASHPGSVGALAAEAASVARQVKAGHITLYPYAHLSDSHADPHFAQGVLAGAEEALRDDGFEVLRAPFGWYKAFELVCKGHPLSELSRTIRPDGAAAPGRAARGPKEHVSRSIAAEAATASRFMVMDAQGELHDIAGFDFSKHPELKAFADYEMRKDRTAQEPPAHVALMQKHELVDYEEGSDSGNLKYYPQGRVMKKVLERYISQLCVAAGAMEVETPVMYDFEHPALKAYLDRFPARQYTVQSDEKQFFLRFAACFGQFLIASKANLSYRHLPVRLYELTRYSFRREQSGELAGLRRLRAFTMPDMHTLVADVRMAKEEFHSQFLLSVECLNTFSIPFEMAFRAEESFFQEHRDFYRKIAAEFGRPILVELFDKRFAYWVTKFEFNYVDGQRKAAALSTVQIDVGNAETYDIKYVGHDGKPRRPLILHTSVSGAVERVLYAVLEEQEKRAARGEKPVYPFFMAPIHVRVIPVSEEFVGAAEELVRGLPGRADIDDRDEKVGRKIRDAEKAWVPLIIVVGEREAKSGSYPVRSRDGPERTMTAGEVARDLEERLRGYPFEPRNGPLRLSMRPPFR
ncbi:MAG TPA: threonine--tRNA ligase [Candidatus Thermoplasmatota archaeon]